MHSVLHLYSVDPDFQTRRSLQLLLKNLGPMHARAIGPGGEYRSLSEAVYRLRGARADEPDVVHAWDARALLAASAAGFGQIVFSPQTAIEQRWQRWVMIALRNAEIEVVCPTEALRQAMIARGALHSHSAVILPAAEAHRANLPRPQLRDRLGIADRDLVLLAPGESTRRSAHRSALWSTAILNVLEVRHRLLVWGRGPMVPSLHRFARNIQAPHVLVDAEQVLQDSIDFEDLVPAADLMIFSSNAGSAILPLAVCLSAALPGVAAATAETSGLLQDGGGVLLEPSTNPRKWAERLLTLERDASLQARLAAAGPAVAARIFSIDRFLSQWTLAYQRVGAEKISATSRQAVFEPRIAS
jgi:hypothetical protein